MENTHPAHGLAETDLEDEEPQRSGRWRIVVKAFILTLLLVFGVAAGAGSFMLGRFYNAKNPIELIQKISNTFTAVNDPGEFFPGRTRVNILCLGLDRNIVKSKDPKINGMPSTKDARSDVMMIATVDFANKTISILSVPRDTRVKLPRMERYSKINEAHAKGGIVYTKDAASQFLGIPIDNYVVIKQEAIQQVVEAVGGVKLKVAKDMDYDDNWGQLHVHLKQGEYKLNGEQVVGFMRFRHDAEGDFGRIRRQQQVIQQLSDQISSPEIFTKALGLFDVIEKYIRTDLSKEQQVALAHMVKKVGQSNIQTLSLPIADTPTIDGVSYVVADEDKKDAAVDWLVNGNPSAMNRLITVELKNQSGSPALYQKTYDCLKHHGFNVIGAGRARGEALTASRVIQRSNLRGSGKRVLETLGVTGNVERSTESGADVTLYVGQNLQASSVLNSPELWPEIPERKVTYIPRSEGRSSRRRRFRRAETRVRVEQPQEEAPPAAETPEPEMDVPGSADPAPAPEPAPAPAPAPPPTPAAPSEPSTE